MKDDESSILNNFLTPGYVNKASLRSTSNGRRRSVHKRIPIFSYSNNQKKNYFIFDHRLSNYEDRSLMDRKVINYDFCGCQSQMSPCDIIMNTFLRKVKGEYLRLSYEQEFQRKEGKTNMRQSRYKRSLLSQLPNWYPQLLYAQLKNLIQVVGVQQINYTQFLCLAAIQYHCKVEYLTYYLYEDLKKSYSDKERFKKDIERELNKLGTNLSQIKMMYSQSIGLSEQLVEFVNDYYDSVGASLVPIQYYAKFMVAIYKHGNRLFVRLLTNFIVYRKEEMKRGLKFLKLNETEVFRNYMRELNFQDFIKQAQ